MLLAAALVLALPVASEPQQPDASDLWGRAEGEPTPPPPTPPPNATCGACRSGSFATPLIYFYWTNTTEQSCCDLCSANASCAFAIRSGTNCFPAPADAAGFKPGGGVTCPTADAPPWPKPPPPPFALSTWPQISALHGNASGGSQHAGTAASVEVTCSGGGCPKPEALSWYRQRLRADAPGEPDSRSQHPITAPAGGLIATVTVTVAAEEHTVMLPDTDESYKITCQPGTCDVSSATTVSRHDIAGIWVAFFSRCQRSRCGQVGALRGLETLAHLAHDQAIPMPLALSDAPRYPYRGLLIEQDSDAFSIYLPRCPSR
eukprot:COSAG04_NODE_1967_length_5113_cov_5.084421_4_plen_318_part_00